MGRKEKVEQKSERKGRQIRNLVKFNDTFPRKNKVFSNICSFNFQSVGTYIGRNLLVFFLFYYLPLTEEEIK